MKFNIFKPETITLDIWDLIRNSWCNTYGWWEEKKEFNGVKGDFVFLSTGGWSDNEEVISSMKENRVFWLSSWVQSRRGGHYVFERKNTLSVAEGVGK